MIITYYAPATFLMRSENENFFIKNVVRRARPPCPPPFPLRTPLEAQAPIQFSYCKEKMGENNLGWFTNYVDTLERGSPKNLT